MSGASVYFEFPTDVSVAGKGSILCTGFSENEHPILAVSTSNGDLTLFHEEGETIAIEIHSIDGQPVDNSMLPASFHRASTCSHLAWQPRRALSNVLACGWADGALTVWSEKERVLREAQPPHRAAITLVRWSPDGQRLLSGDADGMLCVWSIDARQRLSLVARYEQRDGGAVTHVAFRWHGGSHAHEQLQQSCPPFFVGTSKGFVSFADDAGHSSLLLQGKSAIIFLHYSAQSDYLALVDRDAVLEQYVMSEQGGLTLARTVKLSVRGSDSASLRIELCGAGLIAAANRENLLRFFALDKDESYVLSFDGKHMAQAKDVIACIAFNPRKRVLCGGTAAGRIVFWRFVGSHTDEISESDWEGLPAMESSASIHSIAWGPGEGLLALHNAENVSIVLETVMQFAHVRGSCAIQLTADSVQIASASGDAKPLKFSAGIRVKGLDLSEQHVLVWNGKRAELRDLKRAPNGVPELVSSFACRASQCCLKGDEIYCAVGARVEVCNSQGNVQRTLVMAEHEGAPVAMHVAGSHLVVATDRARVAVFDLSKPGEARVVVPHFDVQPPAAIAASLRSRQQPAAQPSPSTPSSRLLINSVRINSEGSKVSLLCRIVDSAGIEQADTRIHVYDVDTDRIERFECGPTRYPFIHAFDEEDGRLLAVESKPVESSSRAINFESFDVGGNSATAINHEVAEVTVLFCTSSPDEGKGLAMQDAFSIDPSKETLMAIAVPHFLFIVRPEEENENQDWAPKIKQRTMRDFVGLESVGAETRRELLAFSFAVTVGNMDEAYRCVKKIGANAGGGGGEAIWENLAQQCVKTKRLDVAEVCLGNLNNARGVRALREARREPELEVAIAEVAVQLHLLDDAERLYKECARWDKLASFYVACGKWKEALAVAARHDRIHLRTLHHAYARHLEAGGEWREALAHFEAAGTASSDVPRMLCDAGRLDELHAYIDAHSSDRALTKWWAQHVESSGDLEAASTYYRRADEHLAVVRVHCFRGELQQAYQLCVSSKDQAACFHLARQFESEQQTERAIELYTLAGRYNQVIRLSIEASLDGPLLTAALQANGTQPKLDAAAYFESRGALEKAAMLYERGGRLHRALDLCFQASLFDTLRSITDRLEQSTDASLLAKCATFFLEHAQYDKGVALLVSAGRTQQALALCEQHNIAISEALAEKMTPARPAANASAEEKSARERILLTLAALCRSQGAFHLACKKFTQAGDSVQAMQCLIKSGDTEKLLYYANMAKKPEVWILAANHLSSLDWRSDANILASLVNYYSKAKAWAQLASFYDNCACVEIDEYRDYDRALAALKEASKAAIKSKMSDKESRMRDFTARIDNIESLVSARAGLTGNATASRQALLELAEQPETERGVRAGDVLAMLVEYDLAQGRLKDAMSHIDLMTHKKIPIASFVEPDVLRKIFAANGRSMSSNDRATGGGKRDEHKERHDEQQDEVDINEDIEQ